MPKYKVFLTRSKEYSAVVDAEDVDDAKAAGEAVPTKDLMPESGFTIEAWDAVRTDQGGAK